MKKTFFRILLTLVRWNSFFDLPYAIDFKNWVYRRYFGSPGLTVLRNVLISTPHGFTEGGVRFNGSVSVGSFAHIDYTGGVTIGDKVVISEGTKIYTHSHVVGPPGTTMDDWAMRVSALEVGDGVWIASNCVILESCSRIGKGAVIGAGSVVTRDIPDNAIVAGVPAKIIGHRE